MRDPVLIQQRTDYLKKIYGPRNDQLQVNRWAYDGEFDKIAAYGDTSLGFGGLDNRRRRTQAIQNWNMMKPVVNFTVIQLSRLPTLSVPSPNAGDQASDAKAAIVENYLYWLWDQSFMDTRHMEIAWNIGCLGSAPHQIVPDFERECCYFIERDPEHCYPMPRGDGQTFEYVSWCWMEDAELLACRYPKMRDRFPRKANRFSKVVEVIEYQDRDDYGFLIDGEYIDGLAGYEHKLGFVPVTVTPAIRKPGAGNVFGPADIDQLIGTNLLLNTLETKKYDALEENLYPRIFTIGDEEPLIDNAPGTVNYLGPPGSDVKQLPPPNIPDQAWAEYDRFMGHIRVHANWSEANSGMIEQSQASGQAIRRLQSPASGLAGIRQSLLAQDMKQMNIYWLRMQEHFFGRKEYDCASDGNVGALRAPGRSSQRFAIKVVPVDDIGGYHRNDVNYSIFGADINSTLMSVQQLGQNGYISKKFGMRLIPGITDEVAMLREIRAERQEEVDFEFQLQARIKRMETEELMKQQEAMVSAKAQMGAMDQQAAAGAAPGTAGPLSNVSVLPSGQPQLMSVGGALSSDSGQVGGLPVTDLKPFGQAIQSMGGQPQQPAPQQAPAEGGVAEAERVTAEEVIAAIQAVPEQIKGGKIRSRSGGFKGDIYLMGEIAQRGGTTDTIDIGYTVPGDWQLITSVLTQWRGRLSGHSLTAAPSVGVLVVKGGQNAVSENTQAA